MWVVKIWGGCPLLQVLWELVSSEYLCPHTHPSKVNQTSLSSPIATKVFFILLVYLLLKISALWMSWVCEGWDGCGAWLPSPCFPWTQDLPFCLLWVLKSKPVCYHMVYQPPATVIYSFQFPSHLSSKNFMFFVNSSVHLKGYLSYRLQVFVAGRFYS